MFSVNSVEPFHFLMIFIIPSQVSLLMHLWMVDMGRQQQLPYKYLSMHHICCIFHGQKQKIIVSKNYRPGRSQNTTSVLHRGLALAALGSLGVAKWPWYHGVVRNHLVHHLPHERCVLRCWEFCGALLFPPALVLRWVSTNFPLFQRSV